MYLLRICFEIVTYIQHFFKILHICQVGFQFGYVNGGSQFDFFSRLSLVVTALLK